MYRLCVASLLLSTSFLQATCSPALAEEGNVAVPCIKGQAPEAVKKLLQKLNAVKPGTPQASSVHESLANIYASGLITGDRIYQVALCWYDHALEGDMTSEHRAWLQAVRDHLGLSIPPQEQRTSPLHNTSVVRVEDSQMFEKIWTKYSQGKDTLNLQQVNSLLLDIDHGFGEDVFTDSWWQSDSSKADPSKELSKQNLLDLYLDNPRSSISRDYMRIFVEGAHPSKDEHKSLFQKSGQESELVNLLTVEYAEMFESIWVKYSQGQESMHPLQLNSLLRDTDHELGEQEITGSWWRSLCEEWGADPSQGLSKHHLLSMYLAHSGSSIKRDYIRIFVEGAAPSKGVRGNLRRTSGHQAEEELISV